MDQWKSTDDSSLNSHPESRQVTELEAKDAVAARKSHKADREKLRRDKLNEIFIELGNAVDPDRPKNDKATILTDAIQTLRDLNAEVNGLKADCDALSEESRELTQEKNELREEKASLKSDIENLNVQCRQRLAVTYPWGAIDPSVVMPPPYPFPVALPVPPHPIALHPSMQPFPLFGNQNPVPVPSPCSTFIPFPSALNPHNDQRSVVYESTSHGPNKQECGSRSSDEDSNDVITELALKTPGSTAQKESSPEGDRKQKLPRQKEKSIVEGSCSSSSYSSQDFQNSSSK